jgi:hypothetical protein
MDRDCRLRVAVSAPRRSPGGDPGHSGSRGVSLTDSIRAIIWLEALSLAFWAGMAARSAGLHGRSLALAVLAGLVVSCVVLALQVIIEPGKAV